MSTFEFSQNLSLGQYLPLDSWIHRLDARVRIVGYIGLLLSITFAGKIPMILLGLAVILLGFQFSKVPLRYALKSLKTPLIFLAFIAIIQFFRFAPDELNPLIIGIGRLTITANGLIAGAVVMIRFITLILLIGLTSYTLSSSDMIYGLQSLFRPLNWIGVHSEDLILVIQVTLHYIPMLGQATEQIAKAQASRGASWGVKKQNLFQRVKTIYPVIIPMFLISLQRAENMALAMDARGYGTGSTRGSYRQLVFKKKDGYFLAAVLTISLAIIIL
jgi:energy-coupling factor transport system permease protein